MSCGIAICFPFTVPYVRSVHRTDAELSVLHTEHAGTVCGGTNAVPAAPCVVSRRAQHLPGLPHLIRLKASLAFTFATLLNGMLRRRSDRDFHAACFHNQVIT